jgi:L-lactate dehydrogenase complex protein LldG
MNAREDILARIGAALADQPAVPEVPRDYRRAGDAPAGSPVLLEQ